nr:hypothetical protein [Chloroflexaceae bacterium]
TLLLIPFFQVFASAEQRSHRWRWPLVGCYLLAWALLAQGDMWAFFSRVAYGPFWQLILSYKFYGLLLLYLAIARTRSPTRVPR